MQFGNEYCDNKGVLRGDANFQTNSRETFGERLRNWFCSTIASNVPKKILWRKVAKFYFDFAAWSPNSKPDLVTGPTRQENAKKRATDQMQSQMQRYDDFNNSGDILFIS